MQHFQVWSRNKDYLSIYEFYINHCFNQKYLDSLTKFELFDLSVEGAILQHYPAHFFLTEKETIKLCLKYNLNYELEKLNWKDISILDIYSLLSKLFVFTKFKYGYDGDFLVVFGYQLQIYWDAYLDYFEKYEKEKYNPNSKLGIDNIIKLGEKMMFIAKNRLGNPSFNNYDYIQSHWEESATKDEFLYIADSIRFKKERK